MDFEIEIGKPDADGAVTVRDNRGGLMRCDNIEQARVYARGMQEGWRTAKNALGNSNVRYAQG